MCVSNFICISERDLDLPIPVVTGFEFVFSDEEWGPTSEWLDDLPELEPMLPDESPYYTW